jgi:hypothetical protein
LHHRSNRKNALYPSKSLRDQDETSKRVHPHPKDRNGSACPTIFLSKQFRLRFIIPSTTNQRTSTRSCPLACTQHWPR